MPVGDQPLVGVGLKVCLQPECHGANESNGESDSAFGRIKGGFGYLGHCAGISGSDRGNENEAQPDNIYGRWFLLHSGGLFRSYFLCDNN